MKKILILIITTGLFFITACEDYLDVNTNPNGPTSVSAFLYLSPMQAQIAEAGQWDARMFAYYTQNFAYYTSSYRYDLQGDPAWTSDMAQYWRCVYWSMGKNLSDMLDKSIAEERWDLVGIGYALRAWGWQMLVDEHGPIIIKEAFVDGLKTFNYDTEEYAYEVVDSLCAQAIQYLNRTDGAVSKTYAAQGDLSYGGDRLKWKKMVYGLWALSKSHLSNKASIYNPQKVMDYVDSSFASNSDNFYIPFTGLTSSDASFFCPTRNNFAGARTGAYTVSLMNGSVFGVEDPRCRIMLPPSDNIVNNVPGAQYIGVVNGSGYSSIPSADQPYNLYGRKSVSSSPAGTTGTYMFKDAVNWPMMTYSELQFIKAEAAMRAGQKGKALTAYENAVSSAIDFTNQYAGATTYNPTPGVSPVSSTEKQTFLDGVVPLSADDLTMSMILCQKYVHLWAWGTLETWMDLRRFHYVDTYGTESTQVFAGFVNPTIYSTNEGKNVNRIRPRYNSEYVWNMDALVQIGADKSTYHTEELWATKPE